MNATKLHFTANFAQYKGGSLAIQGSNFRDTENVIRTANFRDNLANDCGGALYIDKGQIIFNEVEFTKNSKSALCISDSSVTFQGLAKITHNFERFGGGIHSTNSRLSFTNSTEFKLSLEVVHV